MTSARYWMYQAIAATDGESCKSCGKTEGELIIDHINGNRQDNRRGNLRLLCRSCNARNYTVVHSEVSERERENIRDEAEADDTPATLRIAQDKEPVYFAWLYENVGRSGGLTMWQAIYEAADSVGISPITARRYLYKKLATTYELGPGNRGHRLIRERT